MNMQQPQRLHSLLMAMLAGVLVAGCSAMDTKKPVLDTVEQTRKGPEQTPFRSITNFSSALRCMDDQMIANGVHDVSVLVEDLTDQTKKLSAGTKDMMISSVSDMTRRSRAIRLIAYGVDSGNIIGFMQAAERKNAYAIVPQFDLRGSISQFDENVVRKSADLGGGWGEYLSLGFAKSGGASVLGIDLNMLDTRDLSVVPGVTSRNAVVIFKQGTGLDSDAQYKKFGINFSTTLSQAEGNTQALRNLVELASIELFGKLTKVPYWKCLGADPNDAAVQAEISDWFYAMKNNGPEMVTFLQSRLRAREFYNGPVDGNGNAALADAVVKQRTALGLSEEVEIDLPLFTALLDGSPANASLQIGGAPPAKKAATPPEAPRLTISSTVSGRKFRRGELINLTITPSRDAYVYCYLRDENRQVQRFYPNRFKSDAYVGARTPLQLPGAMRFQLTASDAGNTEQVACFASLTEVLSRLPQSVRGTDFEPLAANSLEKVREAFASVQGAALGQANFNIEVAK